MNITLLKNVWWFRRCQFTTLVWIISYLQCTTLLNFDDFIPVRCCSPWLHFSMIVYSVRALDNNNNNSISLPPWLRVTLFKGADIKQMKKNWRSSRRSFISIALRPSISAWRFLEISSIPPIELLSYSYTSMIPPSPLLPPLQHTCRIFCVCSMSIKPQTRLSINWFVSYIAWPYNEVRFCILYLQYTY